MNNNDLFFLEIKSERFTLRQLTLADADIIFELRSHKEINKFITRETPKTLSDATAFIEKIIRKTKAQEIIFWGICLKETNQIIGTVAYHNFSDNFKYAEIGYELHPAYQQKGFMSEVLKATLAFGFKKMKFEVIEAFTHKNNKASFALLEKLHFIFQAERREDGFENNRIFRLEKELGIRKI